MSATPPATAAGALCEAVGVGQTFHPPHGTPVRVLEKIDLEIRPREVVALLGPSGCGKSTLLRILAGLIRPSEGEVRFHGLPLAGLNPGIAIVFQSFALYPWMTAAENVRTVLRARGLAPGEIECRAGEVLRSVGLAGFEDAYPRELSGGMKQRVGLARALSVEPEILFMDEPFSQVDALTAESLRAEVLDIWATHDRNPSSIVMVSHDIKEVAYMADRIVVLSATPGRVRTIIDNRVPRPRDYRAPEIERLVDELHEIITGSELPDVQEPATPAPAVIELLPDSRPTEIVGLLEYLDARGGTDDLFHIVAETSRDFGRVITVTKAAEMLDFVDTPRRAVTLTPLGRRFLAAALPDRQSLWREELLKLALFRRLREVIERQPRREVDRDFVLEVLALALPSENQVRLFETLIEWGQFGGLFDYDAGADALTLA
ncbi:MAG: ATP-binding cassette domain-containing protein [Candidatus Eisenbacteria bacterium]|nr:ATP-binding cassette domain-containing protein [Candidatus Eisenbacteria bacterium]